MSKRKGFIERNGLLLPDGGLVDPLRRPVTRREFSHWWVCPGCGCNAPTPSCGCMRVVISGVADDSCNCDSILDRTWYIPFLSDSGGTRYWEDTVAPLCGVCGSVTTFHLEYTSGTYTLTVAGMVFQGTGVACQSIGTSGVTLSHVSSDGTCDGSSATVTIYKSAQDPCGTWCQGCAYCVDQVLAPYMEVTLDGFANSSCTNCASLNGTYLLEYYACTSLAYSPLCSNSGGIIWRYQDSSTSYCGTYEEYPYYGTQLVFILGNPVSGVGGCSSPGASLYVGPYAGGSYPREHQFYETYSNLNPDFIDDDCLWHCTEIDFALPNKQYCSSSGPVTFYPCSLSSATAYVRAA